MKNTISVLLFLVFASISAGQEKGGKLWGYAFGDYYYKVSGDSTGTSLQYTNYPKDFQAFELRRIYLGYDYTFSDKFSSGFLLEGNDKILTNSRLGIFVKAAFVEWKAFENASFSLGLIPTPTWSWALNEKAWNYRSIEKTILDMRGLGEASDLGVSARGKFDKAGNFGFNFMIGNGNGQKPEINKFKKYYGSLFAKPLKGLSVEVYGDFEPNQGDKNITTLKGFAGYQYKKFNAGVEVIQQTKKNSGGTDIDAVPFGISSFVWGTLYAGKDKPVLNAFARFDMYDPDTKNDSLGYKENFITLGLDYMPIDNVHFMPNVWINSYSGKSGTTAEKKADVIARMTFYYVYK